MQEKKQENSKMNNIEVIAPKEIWKCIKNYEGVYEISNYGNIRKISKRGRKICVVAKTYKKNTGYIKISLSINGGHKVFSLHRLVLESFIGLCPNGMEGCHNDGNLENNCITNLRWDTHQHNIQDSIEHGTFNFQCGRKGSKCNFTKLTERQVVEIKVLIEKMYTDLHIGRIFNVDRRTIADIRLYKTWKHIGGVKC